MRASLAVKNRGAMKMCGMVCMRMCMYGYQYSRQYLL